MRRAQDRARSARSRKNGARSAMIESRALGALKLASDENVPAKRADFFHYFFEIILYSKFEFYENINKIIKIKKNKKIISVEL